MFKIATLADWFGVGIVKGIQESQRCGAQGVQLYAWNDLNPFTARDEIIHTVRKTAEDCGQTITALCGELSEVMPGGHGLEVSAENPPKIEYLKRVLDLSKSLGCDIVTTHIGIIPEDDSSPRYLALQESCRELGEYAQGLNAKIAIETGPEPISRLCRFVDNCHSAIAINYDPANLVMVTAEDEVQGVYTAGSRIVHTHAKDGILHRYIGPDIIYNIFAEGGIEALAALPEYFTETPLGQGTVRWIPYLAALTNTGYSGYLTIEREVGKNAAADIRLAVDFLKEILPKISKESEEKQS